MGDSLPGLQARLMSQAMRKLVAAVARNNTALVFINQLREKIGVMFGSPETTPGGRALKFYSSVRIDIRRIESLKDGQTFIGNRVRCKVVKNKVAPPFRQAEFDIMFTGDQHGINKHGDILDLAVEYDVVKKLGSFYSYGDLRLGQGRMNSGTYLRENEELANEIELLVRQATGISDLPVDEAVVATSDALDDSVEAEVTEAAEVAEVAETTEAAQLAVDA